MLRHWDTLDLNRTSQWGEGERVLVSADLVHLDQYCATEIKDALISAAFSKLHNTKSREKSQISSHLNPISQWGRG